MSDPEERTGLKTELLGTSPKQSGGPETLVLWEWPVHDESAVRFRSPLKKVITFAFRFAGASSANYCPGFGVLNSKEMTYPAR